MRRGEALVRLPDPGGRSVPSQEEARGQGPDHQHREGVPGRLCAGEQSREVPPLFFVVQIVLFVCLLISVFAVF